MSDQDKTKEQLIAELEELRERIRSGSQPAKHLDAELRQQQEHLRRSEERLRLALEAGRMGIWEWTIQTDQVVWSPGLETIHGLAPGKFLSTFAAYQQDIHPEDRDRVLHSIRETVEAGTQHRIEYRLIWPDGSIHWIEDRGILLNDEDGKPAGMIGVSIDISQRKDLEAELRQHIDQLAHAEAHVRSVVNNVIDGIITINERGMILTMNPAAERIFGYKAEEVMGQNVKVLTPEPYRSEHDRYLSNYLRTGQAKIIGIGREVTGKRKDGTTFPMDLGVSEFSQQGKHFFTGIVRDITERKWAENTARFLADTSRSLAALVDYQSTMQRIARLAVPFFADWCTIHMADENGDLRQLATAHADPAKTELAHEVGRRYPPLRSTPVGVLPVFRSGQSKLIPEFTDSMLEELAQHEEHLRILREFAPKSCLRVPLGAHGKNLGVISFILTGTSRKYDEKDLAVAEDLADRAAIAIENARLYKDLRERDRQKDEFLAMLAHELRNPLAPIRTGLDILAIMGVDVETVGLMQHSVEHLVRLVDDLLDVSRIMRGKITLRRETIQLAPVVQRAVESVRPLLDARKHRFATCLPTAPVFVEADPVRLAQVVTNLLSNAAKYTDEGGQVWLSVRQEGEQAILSVQDNGIGISRELLPRIFDLFTQADHSLERSEGGLGIGLTLVHKLVEMHGGTVTARSEGEGKGSEFIVHLPIQTNSETQVPQPNRPIPASRRRILVVEDNVGTARILARLLSKLGSHEIQVAYDGVSALEAAEAQHPEIILLDIGLPGMNGYEVAERLRQQPEFRKTLLVALTGYGTEEDRRRSAEVGFDKHFVKPASLEVLRGVLADPKLAASVS